MHQICICEVIIVSSVFSTLCLLQSIITMEDGKMVHMQRWDGKETSLVREVSGDDLTLVSAHTKNIYV